MVYIHGHSTWYLRTWCYAGIEGSREQYIQYSLYTLYTCVMSSTD
jgi:hypothetical protein